MNKIINKPAELKRKNNNHIAITFHNWNHEFN